MKHVSVILKIFLIPRIQELKLCLWDKSGSRVFPKSLFNYECWNCNSGNYLFTTDTK